MLLCICVILLRPSHPVRTVEHVDCFGLAATTRRRENIDIVFESRVALGQGEEGWGEVSKTRADRCESRSLYTSESTSCAHSPIRPNVCPQKRITGRRRRCSRPAGERRARPYGTFTNRWCTTTIIVGTINTTIL